MSGTKATKGVLRSTVALAAAGSVALAPLMGVAQEAPASAVTEPLAIRIGTTEAYTRIEFAGVVGARSRVSIDGRTVIVRVGTTAAPDISRLKVDPPAGLSSVETRAVQNGTELVLTLADGATATQGQADGAVWVNLYRPGQTPAPAAQQGTATVGVRAAPSADSVTLTFTWDRPVGAAVFRRGEAVWIVFDQAASLDMPGAKDLGPAGEARWARGPDYTSIRIDAPRNLQVGASGQGSVWTVTLGTRAVPAGGVRVDRDEEGRPALVLTMAGATQTIWLTDPLVGDRFAAVTALAPGKGYGGRRQTVDLTVLPSAQGLGIETPTDDLTIEASGDRVRISRPGGLTLSPPSAALETATLAEDTPQKADFPALILDEWAHTGEDGFIGTHRRLQQAAAEEAQAAGDNPRAPVEARLALARFLVGSGLHYEAIGVLNAIVDASPGMLGEAEVRGLRAAARVSIDRTDDAAVDLAGAALANDPSAHAWRGYLAVQQGDWTGARESFAKASRVIDDFPPVWRARFAAAHAEAALQTGDIEAARALVAYALSQDLPASEQLSVRLVQAHLFQLQGQTDRALAVYKAVGRAPLDKVAVPARLEAVRIELARKTLSPVEAAKQLEGLRWRWRGDATELEVIRTLSELYMSQGMYREALTALRSAGSRLSRLPGAAALQADLAKVFRALFLEGGADGMPPIQALGLFYDFRELTPIGADGDEMVRRLARRLIDGDLLDQAAELLKHQVENRLEGVAQASVAADLAAVYLMDRQPEAALQTLWATRTTLLPTQLASERRVLEARALLGLGRFDHALEVLGKDASAEANATRAEIYWKQEKWGEAGALYEQGLGTRHTDTATPLTRDEENRLLRAAVAYSLAEDDAALTRLSANWSPFIEKARSPDALRVALAGLNGIEDAATVREIAALAARTDTFTGWVERMKGRFRNEDGGEVAPAAAG